jgi:hypothetical protein
MKQELHYIIPINTASFFIIHPPKKNSNRKVIFFSTGLIFAVFSRSLFEIQHSIVKIPHVKKIIQISFQVIAWLVSNLLIFPPANYYLQFFKTQENDS